MKMRALAGGLLVVALLCGAGLFVTARAVEESAPVLYDHPDSNRLSTDAAEGKPQKGSITGDKAEVVLPGQSTPQVIYLQLPTYPQNIRQPMGVNVYYGPDRGLLMRQLASLDEARALPPVPGVTKVYLSPWGAINGALPLAARVYRHIRDNGGARTVILVSRTHCQELGVPASVWPNGGYATPVAITNVNALAAMNLLRRPLFFFDPNAHAREASIETNVLLIQHFLPDASIVPVLINPQSKEQEVAIAQALAELARAPGNVLVLVSNLCYAVGSREEAGDIDLKTLAALSTMDINIINNTGRARDARMLHGSGIIDSPKVVRTGMLAALMLEMDTATWLGYASERQIPHAPLLTGFAVGAFSARSAVKERDFSGEVPLLRTVPGRLSPEAEQELAQITRDSLESAAARARYDTPYPQSPELLKMRGVFVTVLDDEERELASMGFLGPQHRLCVAAAEAARMCAQAEDPQMPALLTPEQANRSKIVLSVIKNQQTATSWTDVRNGQGIVLARGAQRCVVLPLTARLHRWSEEDMLAFACKRAGLRPDAYRLPSVDIFTFETDEYIFTPPQTGEK